MKHENMKSTQRTLIAIALLSGSAVTHSAENLTEALSSGKTSANLQLRHEVVRNPGTSVPKPAKASTARLRLGYETGTFQGFSAMVEAESVKALGSKSYDSKATGLTANGYAVVADPESTEINQAYLSYSLTQAATNLKWGRQRLILDNARFIGNVGWRQNEQTFDALTVVNTSLPDTRITAGYLTNVNRIFSDNAASANAGAFAGNHEMRSPILNVSYKGWKFAELVGYGYLLKYDTATAFTANSTDTYGLRLNGSTQAGENKLLYTAEYARQSDGSNNPTSFKADYRLLEGGVDISSAVFKMGYEVLGTDSSAITKATGLTSTKSFSTPLATLHAFNGWADLFLVTPTQGIKDMYVSAGTALAGIKLGAAYHDFSAAKSTPGINDYGTEWDIVATKGFDKNYLIGAKYAAYKTKDIALSSNTNKLWLWGEVKF